MPREKNHTVATTAGSKSFRPHTSSHNFRNFGTGVSRVTAVVGTLSHLIFPSFPCPPGVNCTDGTVAIGDPFRHLIDPYIFPHAGPYIAVEHKTAYSGSRICRWTFPAPLILLFSQLRERKLCLGRSSYRWALFTSYLHLCS